ncbi:MAG: ATP synthase F1 subunit gamma [Acidobacteriota bacterium]
MSGNLIDLRRRIGSVKNTRKITKAMKTVSAVKLRKSVVEINRSNPVLEKLEYLISQVGRSAELLKSPLMKVSSGGETVIVAISADKGLCGSFNSNLSKEAELLYQKVIEDGGEPSFITVGKKVNNYLSKKGLKIRKNFPDFMIKLKFSDSKDLTDYLKKMFLDEEIKEIRFVFTGYKSSAKQEISERTLFPIEIEKEDKDDVEEVEYIFEPDPAEILDLLIPRYINSIVFHTMLESSASEHAARMVAMELASQNASEMINSLTLTMNKLRQASITNELLEIITATEALSN